MSGYQDSLLNELIVDNFAGGGGASIGIELAVGRPVDIAVNHDEDAIAMHKVNHPCTTHYQEDVFAIEPEKVTGGRPVGIAWFSPDCKHFSRAKGGKPVEKKIRGLSWVVLKWAMSQSAPRVIFMENVPEIQTWCPLIEIDGAMRPDPAREGETFNGFIAMLTSGIERAHPAFLEACEFLSLDPDSEAAERLINGLGYAVDYKELKACDFGAPTIRKRFYLIARNDGLPIVFPKPTHGNGKGLKSYRTAAECIDWTIPCPSIFGRKKELAVNTQRRIARGLDKFVIRNPKPFIMQMNFENVPQDIDAPLSTITAINKHYMSVPQLEPYIMSNNTNNASHSIREPLPTVTTGNRNFLCAPSLIQYHSEQSGREVRGQKVDEPIMTIDSSPRYGVNTCFISKYFGGADHASRSDSPLPTVTTAPRHYVVKTYLRKIDGGQGLGNWDKVRTLLNTYAGYQIADDEIPIIEIDGMQYFISDIGMRMLKAKELKLAQGFPIDYVIDIEPYIGKKYSEAKQIARLGNAVCPQVATALIRANMTDLAYKKPLHTVKELNAAMCG